MRRKRSWKPVGLVLAALAAGYLLLGASPGGSEPGEQPPPDAGGSAAGGLAAGGSGAGVPGVGGPAPAGSPGQAGATSVPTLPPVAATPPAPLHDHSGITAPDDLATEQAEQVVRVAEEFAHRWSTPDQDWPTPLRELSTPALAESLDGADPLQPAPRFTAPPVIVLHNPDWARVTVTADRGELVLDLVHAGPGDGGRWLVTAIGWRWL